MFGRSTPYPGRRQPMSIAGRSSQTIHWSIRPALLCMLIPSCQVVEKPPRAVGVVLGGLVLQLGGQQCFRAHVQLAH
jgi:hypothetical protein